MTVQTHELRPAAPRPRSRLALAATAAVVALTLGIGGVLGAFLINGRGAGLGSLASFAPADVAMYAEVDLALPGAQRASLAAFLDHWSAVDPDVVLGDEFADFVDGLILDTTPAAPPFTYTDDLAPWLSGQFAMIMRTWPATPSAAMAVEIPEAAVIVGSRDDAAAGAFAERLRNLAVDGGAGPFESSEHAGVTIWSLSGTTAMVGNAEFAYAVTDGALILATGADEVQRALDTRAGTATLATSADVGRLVAALPAERVGLSVMDMRASLDATLAGLSDLAPELAGRLEDYLAGVPDHVVGSVSFEPDRAVMTSVTEIAEGPFAARSLSAAMAERIPSDALFYAAIPGLGTSVGAGIDLFLAGLASNDLGGPMALDWVSEFESTTGVAVEDLFSWAEDAAVYVAFDGQPSGGLVALTDDAPAARSQIDALVGALVRAAGSELSVETETVDGAEVTRLAGAHGMPPIEIAVGDDRVTLTVGESDGLGELDVAASLGSVDRFADGIGSVGGNATSPALWIDLAGILDAVADSIPEQSTIMMMALGNFEPFDFVASATHEEGGLSISRTDIAVR